MTAIVRLFRNIVGPTAVIAAGTMGAGAVASFLLAGAWFRYELLWVIVAMLPIFVISVDSASRIGALNPHAGMLGLIKSRINPGVAWFILLVITPVHLLVAMGQLSVMSSAVLSLADLAPDGGGDAKSAAALALEIALSLAIALTVLWLMFSRGYDRMQNMMSLMMVLMFFCFLVVALRGFAEWRAILAGFVPSLPPDLPVPGADTSRIATSSLIAMVGSAIAPGALLGMPYFAAEAGGGASRLKESLRRAVINLGVIFGAYAVFVVIAGGFALFPLADHATFSDVNQASLVMHNAFPESVAFVGPLIFTLGLGVAAMTTLVVTAQVTTYTLLDAVGASWRFSATNPLYHRIITVFMVGAAVLAPLWNFPSLLKVVLLMGVNVVVIPMIYVIVIILVNRREVMADHTAEWWRNALLGLGLVLSVGLAIHKTPHFVSMLFS